ncbi:MAG: amidohydrolase family protein [Acidimicrobiia bacterium]|nr:amidohydrolase family protein [Acidimicrobiia bacterium]
MSTTAEPAAGDGELDLLVRRARLRDGRVVDLAVRDGRFVRVAPEVTEPARTEIDASGRLVLPGLVDPHLHVDKALTVGHGTAWPEGTFQESIDMTLERRRSYTTEDLLRRGREVLELAVAYGTTALRAFADVGTVGGLRSAEALLALRDEFADLLDVQVVAFPQEGLVRDPGAGALLVRAMEAGCDVVGAFPWFELSSTHAQEHLDEAFEVARRFDADVHAFVDDEPVAPQVHNLEQLALSTIAAGWQGRVVASHGCGLASYDDHLAERTIMLVRDAGISVCANAHVSLVSKCEHASQPIPRGITRVRELIAAGVNVVTGQDDVADPYYPFGRADMLEVASFLVHTAHLYRPEDVEHGLDAVTENGARAMRLEDYGIREGAWADLVVLDEGSTATDVLRLQPARRWVVRRGRIVATTETRREVRRGRG